MSAGHTPGPWKINHRGDEVMGASGTTVGLTLAKVTQFVPAYRATSDANARLIAAAPELLEALTKLVDLDSDGEAGCRLDPLEYGEALNAGRAAIARATGAA